MFGYSKAPKHLPSRDTLREKSDVTTLLDRIATDDDTYDWSERELNELLEIAATMGIDQEENRGLDLVRREMGRRIGMKKNDEYAAEQERMRIRRSPIEVIRDMGLGIRGSAAALFRSFKNDLKPKKDTRRFRQQSRLLTGVERLEELVLLSGTPIAVEVGQINPGQSLETSEQQFQTVTESTVLAAQETGSSLALSQATNHFFGDPISLNDGESIEVHAQFTVLENSIGDRIAIAGSRSADGRNQLQNAMIVEFGKNGSGYLYLNDTTGQEWKMSFPMEKVDTGSVIDMRMTYDGTTIAVTLKEDGKEIGSTSAAAPKKYDSLSVSASNGKWDRTDATDTMQNFSLVKHATKEVPVPVTIPEQSAEEIAAIEAVFSDPNFMDDLNRELYGQPSQESIQSLTSISIEPETQSSAESTPSSVYSLSAHGTAITATDAEILQKQNAVAGINTQILALQAEMQDANILLEQSNAVLTRWSQQQSLESQKVTPTISVETKRFDRFLYVEYTDMPAGCYLTMSGPRVDASDAQYRLNTGNGKAEFEMPHFGVPNRATVELRGPDGKVVTELYSFNHTKDAASRTGAGSESTRIAKLAHAPEIPANMRVSDTEHMNAILDGAAAGTFLTESGDALTELENSKATLNAEIEALERSRIGTPMMYVTSENTRNSDGPENGLLHVTYSSPHAQTYFEVTIDNDAGAGYRGTVQHASGASNQEFTLNVTGLSGSNGNGGVHIRMYADDTKTQLLDSFDASYDRRHREVNGETARDADAFRDGIRIDEHANGDTAYLPIPGLSGNVLMQSWNMNGAQGNMDYELAEGAASFTAQGTLSSLDFSGTQGTVTDVYADLDIPEGVTVEALIFRGGIQIGSMELTRGMPLLYSDVGGFSSILFKTDNPTALTLNELLVDMNPEELFSAEVLSRAENGTLAGLLATEDFGKIESILVGTRFQYVLGQHNIYNHRGGAAGAIGNQYFLINYGGGTYDTYTLYKPDTTGPGASLGEVHYLNDEGFHVLPQEYYTRINGAIIMHPGAPKNIAIQIASGSGVTAYQAGTASDIDLLINSQTDFHPEVSVQHLVNGPTSYTGFSNGFNQIGQVSRPVIAAGETFHVVSLVYNNSGVTGQITVEVFTGDNNALVAGDTYTGTIGAYQRAQFTANATSPANATGLPSVRFRVTLPDGTQYWSGGMRSAVPQNAPGEGSAKKQLSQALPDLMDTANQFGLTSAEYGAEITRLRETYGSAFARKLNDLVITSRNALGLSDPGSGGVVTGSYSEATAGSSNEVIFTSGAYNLGTFGPGQELTGGRTVYLSERGMAQFTFTVTEEKMVNLWIPGTDQRDVTLRISGTTLAGGGYASEKAGFSAESVSLKLTPGTYNVSVIDNTNYSQTISSGNFSVQLGHSTEKYNSANIRGMISIEGNEKVMPVSMRVAEFDSNTGDRLPAAKNGLNPNQPVWVVVHGMDSKPDDAVMNELTKSLYSYAPEGIQVFTIDWQEAAASGFIMTQDAPWTTPVGNWTAQQLINAGFRPDQINVAAWSHGTFVAYEMGVELQRIGNGQMHTLVALDAARNIPLISGYNHTPDFSSISMQSVAFDSSVIAGDNALATKADYSFLIRSTELNPSIRHKLAVTAFTSLLNSHGSSAQFSQVLNFQKLMGNVESTNILTKDAYMGGFEGVIDIGVERTTVQNEAYYKALLETMSVIRPDTSIESLLHFHSIEA